MPSDAAAAINRLAIREMLDLPKLYGPNGLLKGPNGETAGPPSSLVAALEQLETAAVDPGLLTGDQTVARSRRRRPPT